MNYNYFVFLCLTDTFLYIIMHFININHKNYKKRKLNKAYYINTTINFIISAVILLYILLNHSFLNHIYPKIQNIIFYALISDALYYLYHRFIHRNFFLKKHIHATHHQKLKLIPLDSIYSTYYEGIINMLIISVMPLLVSNVNLIEYFIVNFILLLHVFYIHYDAKSRFILPLFTKSNYHKRHHAIGGGGNYSLFFPIWDNYMNTNLKYNARKQS